MVQDHKEMSDESEKDDKSLQPHASPPSRHPEEHVWQSVPVEQHAEPDDEVVRLVVGVDCGEALDGGGDVREPRRAGDVFDTLEIADALAVVAQDDDEDDEGRDDD